MRRRPKEKKKFIAYNKFCGTGSIKHHVEALHLKLLMTYVVDCFIHDNVTSSQERSDEGGRLMQPTKKCTKVVAWVVSSFFCSKTPYKRHDEVQKLLLEDLMLLTAKGYLPLNTCENVWMRTLALRLEDQTSVSYLKNIGIKDFSSHG